MDIEKFKSDVDRFFTIEFSTGKDKDASKLKESPSQSSQVGSSIKATKNVAAKNALEALKLASFIVFIPLGLGAIINHAYKWNKAKSAIASKTETVAHENQSLKSSHLSDETETSLKLPALATAREELKANMPAIAMGEKKSLGYPGRRSFILSVRRL